MKTYLISFKSKNKLIGCSTYFTRMLKDAKKLFTVEHIGEDVYITKIEIL